AGLPRARLVAEPMAAAAYFVHIQGADLPVGRSVVVYDPGAGAFDASVVRRESTGFTVLANSGLTDAGGLDIDAAIVGRMPGGRREGCRARLVTAPLRRAVTQRRVRRCRAAGCHASRRPRGGGTSRQ